MARIKDLLGLKFGRLTVINQTNERSSTSVIWECRCSCGNIIKVASNNLTTNHTQSCGCLRIKHGACKSGNKKGHHQLDYVIWSSMKQRCYDKNCPDYKYYGAKGISVYKEWKKDFTSFASYIRTLPDCPNEVLLSSRLKGKRLKMSIDRINSKKDYRPGNLRWSTIKQQNRNKKNVRLYNYKGEMMNLKQICDTCKVSYGATRYRVLNLGWDLNKAINTPLQGA